MQWNAKRCQSPVGKSAISNYKHLRSKTSPALKWKTWNVDGQIEIINSFQTSENICRRHDQQNRPHNNFLRCVYQQCNSIYHFSRRCDLYPEHPFPKWNTCHWQKTIFFLILWVLTWGREQLSAKGPHTPRLCLLSGRDGVGM